MSKYNLALLTIVKQLGFFRLLKPLWKPFKHNPLRALPIIFSLLAISLIILFTVHELEWNRVRLPVRVITNASVQSRLSLNKTPNQDQQDNRLTIPNSFLEPLPNVADYSATYLHNYLSGCERIVAIDGISIQKLLDSKIDTTKNIFLSNQDDTFSLPLTSLKNGQIVQFWSTSAKTLTLDLSSCKGAAGVNSSGASNYLDRVNHTQCPQCFTPLQTISANILAQSEGSPKNANILVDLNLDQIKIFTSDYVFILLTTLITLSFCLTGLFFNILRPDRAIIIVHNIFLSSTGLVLLVLNSGFYYLSQLEISTHIIAFQLVPASFLYFVLLFPDGKPITKIARLALIYCNLVLVVITLIEIYLNVFEDQPNENLEGIKVLSMYSRYIDFATVFGAGLVILAVKYVRSRRDERIRLRMAVYSLIISVCFPFLAFILNAFFDLLQDWVEYKFGLILLPTLLIPVFFAYAMIKNKLFGVDIKIRRFIAYAIVISCVTCAYYVTSVLAALLLPFNTQLSNEPIFNIVYLVILTELIHLFFNKIQKFVDKRFSVDPLNHSTLNDYWINELAKTYDLNTVCEKVTRELAVDYHYKSASLLLFYSESKILLSYAKNKRFVYPSPSLWREQGLKKVKDLESPEVHVGIVIDRSDEIHHKVVGKDFWLTLQKQNWILGQDDSLSAEIRQNLQQLSTAPTEVAIPLRLGDKSYGALILGEKISEYSPPPSDELEHLRVVANQIAASIHNSILLAEAKTLAEKEKQLRLDEQAAAQRDKQIRQQTLSNLADAIHGEPLQDLFVLKQRLEQSSPHSFGTEQTALTHLVTSTINDFRVLTAQLRLFSENEYFTEVLKRLIGAVQAKHNQVTISLELLGEAFNEYLLDSLLTEQLKLSLFRIIQEAINNALKHSGATAISVSIELSQEQVVEVPFGEESTTSTYLLEIQIDDNGIGVSENQLRVLNLNQEDETNEPNLVEGKHLGTRIIKSLIRQYMPIFGAQLGFYSTPLSGLQVAVALHLPLVNEPSAPLSAFNAQTTPNPLLSSQIRNNWTDQQGDLNLKAFNQAANEGDWIIPKI